jgi:6-phosphogluconolactonase
MIDIEACSDRGALAAVAAAAIAEALARPGPVSFVAAGGSTPGATYDRLAAMDLDWSRVTVTLGDERWVDPAAPESNARLVRVRLLAGHAAAARFVALKGRGATPEEDALAVEPRIAVMLPFDAVLLGMGEDGHVASLFPGDPEPGPKRLCVGVAMSGLAPFVPRLTLTLAALLRARQIFLLITGEAKRALVERVSSEPDYAPPVAAILRQSDTPLRVLWSP